MNDPITRLNAALSGRYRIERQLGEGGMATVYLADDLRHERKVALKVLKPELAAVVGAERFLAEIKTTANLQHPHLLPLFDSGQAGTFLFYVMPFMEGETLRDRLDREHQLPVDEAVQIAKDVAEALAYAHGQGVIHRDIKPANILIQAGRPVLSDFGIALAVGVAGGGRLTETGLSLGTPHYMSPEQATGDASVGAATDIYALGCVLYEMLVGDPPHTGSTPQAVLGKIVMGDADRVTRHRKSVPANVDAAIRKALEKLPADRFSGAQDFAKALGEPGFRYGDEVVASGFAPHRPWQAVGIGVAGLLIGVAGMSALGGGEDAPSSGLLRFTIDPPAPLAPVTSPDFPDLAISADGRRIVYMGLDDTGTLPRLIVRAVDQLDAAPLRGGERGAHPFFSADGEWVGFWDVLSSQLQKVSILGGAPVTLAQPRSQIRGASWGADDLIVFGTQNDGLFRVSGGGGEPEALTTLDLERGEANHRWPSIVEGRDAVIFVISQGPGAGELAALDLGTGGVTRLGLTGSSPRYVSTGHLLYADTDGSVRAVPFDPVSLEVTGSPVPLIEGVMVKESGAAQFSVSNGGRLVYEQGESGAGGGDQWEFVWVDRRGNEEPLPMPARAYNYPALSPDGRRVATSVLRGSGQDLWVFDVATGAGLRLTHDDETNWIPIWAPDGQSIFFSSTRDAPRPNSFTGSTWYGNISSVAADGSSAPQRVTTSEENQGVTGISPDGRTLVHSRVFTNVDHWEIMALPSDGGEPATPLVAGRYRRGSGTISPDGRWLAYRSDESGSFEVFVEPYPGPGAKVPASIGGGTHPGWSADSRELFYRGTDGMMMAATIAGEATPAVTDRTPLFPHQPYRSAGGFRMHDEAPDGRFLMMRRPGSAPDDRDALGLRITVVDNWFEELRGRVPN